MGGGRGLKRKKSREGKLAEFIIGSFKFCAKMKMFESKTKCLQAVVGSAPRYPFSAYSSF